MTTSDRPAWPRTLADCHLLLDSQRDQLMLMGSMIANRDRAILSLETELAHRTEAPDDHQ